MTAFKKKGTSSDQPDASGNETPRDFIEELSRLPEVQNFPWQTMTLTFPVVTEEQEKIAFEAYCQIAFKYGLNPEDTSAFHKATLIVMAARASRGCGKAELASEEIALKVKWQ